MSQHDKLIHYRYGNYPLTVCNENPYADSRLGGIVRYFVTPRADFNMRVPDEILKCVVFIGKKTPAGDIHYGGTGFLVLLRVVEDGRTFYFNHLVTAKHVAEQISGDVFYLRMNGKNNEAATDVPLNWEPNREVIWYEHPTDPIAADVAITPIQVQPVHDAMAIPDQMIVSDEKRKELGIGVGDEVFAVGLFSYLKGKSRSVPIVRVGNIAMFPNEQVRVETKAGKTVKVDGFLIEARSISALSGSPVLARRTAEIHGLFKWGTNQTEPVGATAATLYLIGLVCAHWDIKPSEIAEAEPIKGVNVGLAVVIPAQKIIDILHGSELTAMRKKIIEGIKEKEPPAATMDSGFPEASATQTTGKGYQIPVPTKEQFLDDLEKASRKKTR